MRLVSVAYSYTPKCLQTLQNDLLTLTAISRHEIAMLQLFTLMRHTRVFVISPKMALRLFLFT